MNERNELGMFTSEGEGEQLDFDDYKDIEGALTWFNNFKNTVEFLNSLSYHHVMYADIRDSESINLELDWFPLEALALLGEAAKKDLEAKNARNS